MAQDEWVAHAWESENTKVALAVLTRADERTCLELRKLLQTNVQEGILRLANRVQAVLQNERKEAVAVTRNVVGAVFAEARFRQHLTTDIRYKIWVCSRGDPELPKEHDEVERRYRREPCPMDKPFIVNNACLMHPRDFLSGAWEECIGCQCLMIAKYSQSPCTE